MTGPPVGKGVESAIKYLLTTEYKFIGGDRVQDMLAKDLIQLFRQHTKDPWTLEDGQILWFAVHIDEKPGPAKTLAKMKIVPVVLSVIHKEDRDMIAKGYPPRKVRRFKVARLCNEAYKQNGVLSQFDLAEMLCVSSSTIGIDIRKYEKEFGVILPYRGTIHDIGPSLTHKKVIVSLFLQNVATPDIARKTCHTQEACDRYIKAFKRVNMLYGTMTPREISLTLDMSERLVNEYIALIEEKKVFKGGSE